MLHKSYLRVSAATAALCIGLSPVFAQSGAGDTGGLEEVVVTANKRHEKIEDVPASVLALTADQLQTQNVRDFDNLVNVAPNLTITKTSQPGNNSINMRGVGTYSLSIASQTSVAVVIDDVPQAIQAEAFGALVGVQQIEVLRGPQSTLFGKSADSGVISITTQQPTDHFTFSGNVLHTSDHENHIQAAVAGPVTDNLKMRLTVNDSDYRGSIFNVTTANWLDGTADKTVRASILFQPTEDWTVTFMPYATKTTASCCAVAPTLVSPGATFPSTNTKVSVPLSQVYPGVTPGPENKYVAQSVDASGNADDFGAGLKIAHEFADGTQVMSISSFDHYELDDRQSTDQSAYNFQLLNPKLPFGGSANGGYFHVTNVTEEVRVVSPESYKLKYVGGIYTSEQNASRYYVRGADDLGTFNGQTPLATSSPYSRYSTGDIIGTAAAFGQGSYDLLQDVTLVGGVRYEHEWNSYKFNDLVDNVSYGMNGCNALTPSGLVAPTCNDSNAVTGKAALQYHVTPDFMLFANFSTGYKGLAYDLTSALTVRTPLTSGVYKGYPNADVIANAQPIAEETSKNYEIGYKGSFFQHHLTWNLTGFYDVFTNYQSSREDPITQLKELQSVPKVTTKGVETEIAAKPISNLTISASGAYDIAQSDDFTGAACFSNQSVAQGCIASQQDLSGVRLSNAPRWSGNINAEYDFDNFGDVIPYLNLNYRYQSAVWFNTSLDPNSYQQGYGLMNLQVGAMTDHYRATFFVNNVANQHYALERGSQTLWSVNPYGGKAGAITNATFWVPGRDNDRYFGVKLEANY